MKKWMILAVMAVFSLSMSAKEPVKCCCTEGGKTECKCKDCKCNDKDSECADCAYCKDCCKGKCCHDSKNTKHRRDNRRGGCCGRC